jgi:serine phosphatase RsbU (regulator of sigma subunit)
MPLFVLAPGQEHVQTVDGERTGLGYVDTRHDMTWKNRIVPLAPGTMVFATTDGIIDQIGGAKNIAYGKQRLRDALVRYRGLPMPAVADALMQEQRQYQGRQRRRDDLTFFGFRPA